ncbi:MAG: hypothetical protein OER88_07215 [Planctomycetota bacterium]|nr:hypothetical protein [Planctomycetota bacterium]
MAYLAARIVYAVLLLAWTWGLWRVLRGGRREAGGEVEFGARTARLGGFVAISASCACVAVGPGVLAFMPDPLRDWMFASGGSAPMIAVASALGLTVLCGFLCGLAGLSGKPRPTGWAAALVWVGAISFYAWLVVAAPP